MRAAVLAQPGGPEGIVVSETPAPRCRPDEVLVEVRTVGANQLDLNTMRGLGPGAAQRFPLVLGIDPAGVIVDQGSRMSTDRRGERVVVKPSIACGDCLYCRIGQEADCVAQTVIGVHRPGGAAGYVAVPTRNAFPIGDLPFEVATAAVHSAPIAMHALRATGELGPEHTILVTGATGAVGSAAVQLAKRTGAVVLAASRSADLNAVGVVGVRYADAAGLEVAVRDRTPDGRSIDRAIDCTGHGAVISASLRCLGWKGRLAICSGSLESAMSVDARDVYLHRKSIVGTASAHYTEVAEALEMVATGEIVPTVGAHFDLPDIQRAYAALSSPGRRGKVVINVG